MTERLSSLYSPSCGFHLHISSKFQVQQKHKGKKWVFFLSPATSGHISSQCHTLTPELKDYIHLHQSAKLDLDVCSQTASEAKTTSFPIVNKTESRKWALFVDVPVLLSWLFLWTALIRELCWSPILRVHLV